MINQYFSINHHELSLIFKGGETEFETNIESSELTRSYVVDQVNQVLNKHDNQQLWYR